MMRMNASSPERQPLPLASWPAADREAYAAACRRGDPFEEGGSAALWRPATHAGRICEPRRICRRLFGLSHAARSRFSWAV